MNSDSYAESRNDAYEHAGYAFLSKLLKRYDDKETYPKLVYQAYDFGIRVLLEGLRYRVDAYHTAYVNVNRILADSHDSNNKNIKFVSSCSGNFCTLNIKTDNERYVLTELGIISSNRMSKNIQLVHPKFLLEPSVIRPENWLGFGSRGESVKYFRFTRKRFDCLEIATPLSEFSESPQVFKILIRAANSEDRFLLIGHNKPEEEHCILQRDQLGRSYLGGIY
jgi:hypothetical protein